MNSDSGSDFEDPDEIGVPGGGKDIYSLVTAENLIASGVSGAEISKTSRAVCVNKLNVNHESALISGSPMLSMLSQTDLLTTPTPVSRLNVQGLSNYQPQQKKMILQLDSKLRVPQFRILAAQNSKIGHLHSHAGVGNLQNMPTVLGHNNINNEADNEEEGMGVAETYAIYMPAKLKLGRRHPDPVVESTSLSSVEPIDVWYKLIIPENVIISGALSALQLESITYACQQHEKQLPDGCRAGFLIGDGAGVGKGRTIAGIIYENYLRGRKKAIWISVMSDLKVDAERDLADIGASINVYSLNKCKYSKLSCNENGKIKKGVIFCTYSAIIAKTSSHNGSEFETRLDQIIDWCGTGFDGCLIFDECHKAKNLSSTGVGRSTKTGQIVLEIQRRLPSSRVVYASATGATEPKNMAYMVRLGMWGKETPYKDFSEFLAVLQRRGVGAMEIVAMDMKLRGLYIARQLSFQGVIFKIQEVKLNKQFTKVYDNATSFWAKAYEMFSEALSILRMEKSSITITWSQFWSAHQRFFKYMCIAAKVKEVIYLAREAIKCGKCVVIGLQSTGEARTLEHIDREDGELTDFVSTAQGVIRTLVEKHFPDPPKRFNNLMKNENRFYSTKKRKTNEIPYKKKKIIWDIEMSDESSSESEPDDLATDQFIRTSLEGLDNSKYLRLYEMKQDLLHKVEQLGRILPPNSLDELIDELGGPDNVAEMTGRKGRIIHSDGNFKYMSRSHTETSLEVMNLMEKKRFMDGEKDVAIISEAASSGISLHSDRRAINRKCRVHITLELPWSADKAIQQFGRTHRSNQVNAPEYILLISNLGGERRFASIVAKRLESLGALTQGDRRATEARDLSKFNIDNNYGRAAVEITLKSLLNIQGPDRLVSPPSWYKGDFVKDAQEGLKKVGMFTDVVGELVLESDKKSLGKFLNRLLGLPVSLQNALFEYFTDTMEAVIDKAKREGHFDLGILDVATSDQTLNKISVYRFVRKHVTGKAAAELYKVSAERGMSWEEAERLWERAKSDSKFYVSPSRNGKREVLLALLEENSGNDASFSIYRPNLGKQVRKEVLSSILRKYSMADIDDAKEHWTLRYKASIDTCSHKYWGGFCKRSFLGESCDVGLRRKIYYILSGSVLSVWNRIEETISKVSRLQVVRVKTTDGEKIVGTLVPSSCVGQLISTLSTDAEKVSKEDF